MNAPARWATPPTPGATHEGRRLALVMQLAGVHLMPWQRQVARVATEHHPSGIGWRYKTVVVTVPRQSGKTTLLSGVELQRAMDHKRHQIWMTCQRGKDAQERWRETAGIITEGTPAARQLFTPRLRGGTVKTGINRGAGSSAMYWANGSRFSPFAPVPTALDGYKTDTLIIDEAFAFTREFGNDLLGSIKPTSITRPWRQMWIVSTAGTMASTWLRDWVERGRLSADDPDSDLAYFEWSTPDDLDPYSLEAIRDHHPAYGHTITHDALVDEMAGPRSVWERAYLNRWVALALDTIVPLDQWASLARDLEAPTAGLTIGIDVARDRSAASLAAAWREPDGRVHGKILASGPGTAWLNDALRGLEAAGTLVADPTGPTRTLLDELADVAVERLTPTQYSAACQSWYDRTHEGTATHSPNPILNDNLNVAAIKVVGGLVTLDADRSAGPIDALRAIAIATAGAASAPNELQVF